MTNETSMWSDANKAYELTVDWTAMSTTFNQGDVRPEIDGHAQTVITQAATSVSFTVSKT